jgi:hypothetical protein
MLANLAGYLGNHNIGWLKAHGYSDRVCLLFLAGCYLMGAVLVSFVRVAKTPKTCSG